MDAHKCFWCTLWTLRTELAVLDHGQDFLKHMGARCGVDTMCGRARLIGRNKLVQCVSNTQLTKWVRAGPNKCGGAKSVR